MKRIALLLLILLLLTGCARLSTVTESTPPPETTQPEPPNLVEQGRPWDREGILTEIPLTIAEGWKYTNYTPYKGKLLLYGFDNHLEGEMKIALLLVDPLTGEVGTETTLPLDGYASPQVFGDQIFLCDSSSGNIYELDGNLALMAQWQVEPSGDYWVMGAQNTLYQFTEGTLMARNLITGEQYNVTESGSVNSMGSPGMGIALEYSQPETGKTVQAWLDLTTGELTEPPFRGRFTMTARDGDLWLCRVYGSSDVCYLGAGSQAMRVHVSDSTLQLLAGGLLLESSVESNQLRLYDQDGRLLSGCQLSETGSYYLRCDPIPCEELGGFFLVAHSYDGDTRLLYWDTSKGTDGESLALEPVPEPSEAAAQLRHRADELELEYGVTIWIGEECQTEFWDFQAELITDWEEISQELNSLEIALDSYPEGFFRQLKFDYVQGIQIHLVQNLEATTGDRVGGSYSAFAQQMGDHYMVVSDILMTNEYTYYHEFSHIIDRYLEWESWNREDSLYSEIGWAELNPSGFDYTYYYGGDFSWFDYDYHSRWFIDSYATTFPTEDRARVMEYAMMPHSGWYFENSPGLVAKLEYYSRCIRDAFNTSGWPDVTLWEQYLPQ